MGQKEKGFRISASRFPSAPPVGCEEEERSPLHLGGAKRTARRRFCSKTPEFSPNSPWGAGSAAAPSLLPFLPRSPAPREHRAWLPPTWGVGGDPLGLLLSRSGEHCLKTSLKTKKKKQKRGKKSKGRFLSYRSPRRNHPNTYPSTFKKGTGCISCVVQEIITVNLQLKRSRLLSLHEKNHEKNNKKKKSPVQR